MPINDRVVEIASLLSDDTPLWGSGSKNFTSRLGKTLQPQVAGVLRFTPRYPQDLEFSQMARGLSHRSTQSTVQCHGAF